MLFNELEKKYGLQEMLMVPKLNSTIGLVTLNIDHKLDNIIVA